MSRAAGLRAGAEALAGPFPPLLAEAQRLASTVLVGEHGRRRPGMGDSFWQYRPAQITDEARSIDWRRSARSDLMFVQDKEWQIAQSVVLWVSRAASMRFASTKELPTKAHRASVLALAAGVLLARGGERIGMADTPPRRGEAQLARLADALVTEAEADYQSPSAAGLPFGAGALWIGDFLEPTDALDAAVGAAADRGVRGALMMVLDPQEEAFPFDGRTIFDSMAGSLSHETLKARDLRDRYLDRLAARKDHLAGLARRTGWQFSTHLTDDSASTALLWAHGALGGR